MGTTAILATSASIQSSIAIQQASEAKDQSCKVMIKSFDSKSATVQEMQSYSECVGRIYPEEVVLSGLDILLIKISIVVVLVGASIFAWKQNKGTHTGVVDWILGFVFGGLLSLVLLALFAGLVFIIHFLFAG